jgi:LysM repeat protein
VGRFRLVDRRAVARYGAPLVFLAALTAAVLLVRSGLDEGSSRAEKPVAAATTSTATTPGARAHPRYYRIRPGDTLAQIAPRFDLTEAKLVDLNPGIEPTALRVGQKIRVR